ncbi:MAG: 30S ribosome-binding factor RbfA [Myxococcota bacterium]|nr:30S ribosome-binding factor RbfA [Myxococcota bacterium]
MGSQGKRSQRVGQQIKKRLSELLLSGLRDPRIGFATVTEVRVTNDLGHAKVFVSVYGVETDQTQTILGLQMARGYLRKEVARVLRIRHVPELDFVLDEGLDRAVRLEQVFGAISKGESEVPVQETHEPVAVDAERSALLEAGNRIDQARAEESKREREQRRRTGRERRSGRPKRKS